MIYIYSFDGSCKAFLLFCAEGAKSSILRSATGLLRTDMRSQCELVCCTLMILDTIPDDSWCAWRFSFCSIIFSSLAVFSFCYSGWKSDARTAGRAVRVFHCWLDTHLREDWLSIAALPPTTSHWRFKALRCCQFILVPNTAGYFLWHASQQSAVGKQTGSCFFSFRFSCVPGQVFPILPLVAVSAIFQLCLCGKSPVLGG